MSKREFTLFLAIISIICLIVISFVVFKRLNTIKRAMKTIQKNFPFMSQASIKELSANLTNLILIRNMIRSMHTW